MMQPVLRTLEAFHVSDIQTTFEPETKKRPRVS